MIIPGASNSIHQFPDVATGMRKWTVALLKKGEAQRFINYFAAPCTLPAHKSKSTMKANLLSHWIRLHLFLEWNIVGFANENAIKSNSYIVIALGSDSNGPFLLDCSPPKPAGGVAPSIELWSLTKRAGVWISLNLTNAWGRVPKEKSLVLSEEFSNVPRN